MFNGDKRGVFLSSRTPKSLSGCLPAACGGRDAAAAPAPPCGSSGNTAAPSRAGKMAPGSRRRLRGERCKLLLACTYTHGTMSSPGLLLAPVDTAGPRPARCTGAIPTASHSQECRPGGHFTPPPRHRHYPQRHLGRSAPYGAKTAPGPRSSDSPSSSDTSAAAQLTAMATGSRTRCPPCAVTAASALLPGCAPAPVAASRTFLCARTSTIRTAFRPGVSARTCADDSSLLVIPNPEKIHSHLHKQTRFPP